MSQLTIPRTPSPQILASPAEVMSRPVDHLRNGRIHEDLTPPPSSQVPQQSGKPLQFPFGAQNREELLVSPPPTVGPAPAIFPGALFGEIPSTENIHGLDEGQLRNLVTDLLLPALGEARMTAAHHKLQYNLLSIENAESMQRAAVEHEMTHREIQVLQGCAHDQHDGKGTGTSPQSLNISIQKNLDLALKRCQHLHKENTALNRRLQKAKKLLGQKEGHIDDLEDRVLHLRHRIRQNRDHFNALRASGAVSSSNTPAVETPIYHHTPKVSTKVLSSSDTRPRSQSAFDALLIAGEVMSGEAASVPSTPTPLKPSSSRQSHTRGAHSLSSLQKSSVRGRPALDKDIHGSPSGHHLAPPAYRNLEKVGKDRHDRDSTISISDHEDMHNQLLEDVPASQASQKATSMLRQSMRSENYSEAKDGNPLVQAKLYGHVKKQGSQSIHSPRKRTMDHDYDRSPHVVKKPKLGHTSPIRVGLGIGNIPSPMKGM